MRSALRPLSFWLFLISVPVSYVLFTVLLTAAVLATVPEPDLDDVRSTLYLFSIWWVAGCYVVVPACWTALSLLGMGIRTIRGRSAER